MHISRIKSFKHLLVLAMLAAAMPGAADQVTGSVSQGRYITLSTTDKVKFNVYVSGPEDAQKSILLVHGWLGLDKNMESQADMLARDGFFAMAIDLYSGETAVEPKKAKELMNAVRQSDADAKYATAIGELKAKHQKVAVIGWSYGGSQALHAALVTPELVSATVIYYPFGALITERERLSALKTPILGHFARNDFANSPEKVKQFTSAVDSTGNQLVKYVYDAKHGFANATGKNFSEFSQRLAYKRTVSFLNKNLM